MSETAKRVWWCGWEAPEEIPEADCTEGWPRHMRGWLTGWRADGSHSVWVGAVYAESAEAAWTIVGSAYTTSAGRLVQRWEPEACDDDWNPGERFPNYSLEELRA